MNRLPLRWPVVAIFSTIILAFLAIGTHTASAQSTSSGIIVGEVKDPTHAFVPGAVITAIDPSTGIKYSTVSDSDGKYVLPDVPPGNYTVTATKMGFATDRIDGLAITVGSQTTANFSMSVGSESTTIEVQATNADLQTMNSTIGGTVTQEQIDALPSINRDVSSFAAMQPGVTPNGFVAGTNADQAVFMLDGGNNSSDMDGSMSIYTGSFGSTSAAVNTTNYTSVTAGGSSSGVVPMPQDSMEEFRVATTGQTADFNNSVGFQVQTVTKRGHNEWHGTAYEYYLDSSFGAGTWSNNLSGTAKAIYHYNRFGGAGGGPIVNKNFWGGKTYIFANYEGFHYPLSAVYERVVPSTAFEAGNITLNEATTPTPYTAAQVKAADPRGIGLDPTVQAYWLKYEPQQGTTYPGGNFDGSSNKCGSLSSSTTCDGVNTVGYISHVKTPLTSNFAVVRMDHDFGPKWHLMASYRYYRLINLTSNQVDIGGYFSGDALGQAVATDPRPQQPWYFVTGLTTNISSSLTNSFHYSYLRNLWLWADNGAPPPSINGGTLGAALEPGGESATTALAPITENNQNIRTRTWDGHTHFFADDVSKLKGNHLFQFGGQYEHDFAYHSRTDNGGTVNYYPVYQLGETGSSGLVTLPGLQAGGLSGANTVGANKRLLAMNLGIVTDSQVVYTRSGSALTLNSPLTPAFDQSTIPFYNMYFSDTWHVRPSLTINYGLGYSIEMPPLEKSGKQVALVDGAARPIVASQYLTNRANAAALGQVYNPQVGYALIANTANGGTKYPYNPYFAQLSPRISLAWDPKFKNAGLNKLFGDGATVVRGGYGRTYGRLNGVGLVLVPLLGPGLIQSVDCQNPLSGGTCGASSTDTTNFRIGVDGPSAPLPAVSTNLPQPFYPGYNGAQTSSTQTIDPTLRPPAVDTFNLSIQRQVTRKTLVEVGYIGRIIKHSYESVNLNAVPYMMSVGGQTFSSAYLALETAYGCTVSAGLCLANTAGKTSHPAAVLPQPFFETALGGPTSAYCSAYSSCTAAVVAKENTNIGAQQVYQLFSDLDNGPFNFPGYSRIMQQTPIPGQAFGATGQLGSGADLVTSSGYGNYNAMFITFRASNWHGLTAQENFTYGKALGLYDQAQSSSNLVPNDAFDYKKSYGVQSYQQKFIFNTFVVWQTPWYKSQSGIIGRLAGGWIISPVFTAGSGQPRYGTDLGNNGTAANEAFGEGNGTFGDNEQLVFTTPYKGGYHTHRGATGGVDPYGNSVGTKTAGPSGSSTAVNVFADPVAVWNTVRPPILGLDEHDGGAGPIQGLPYWGLDMSIQKTLKIWEKTSLTFYGVSTNVLNHLVFANGSMTLSSSSNWGEVTGQANNPRQIQIGARVSY